MTTPFTDPTAPAKPVLTGRHILAGMAGFFGVVFAVNAAFVYFAIDSWPGLTADRAYVEGLEYERVLEAADAQARLGWQTAVMYDASDRQLSVTIVDADGARVRDLRPVVRLQRPVGDSAALEHDAYEISPGHYAADVPPLTSGRWSAEVTVDSRYRMNHALWITP